MPFTYRRRVEFGDTDMAGIVHFSNYFRYMEAAETAFLRSLGLSVTWEEGGVRYGFPRVSAACDYRKPARFEDEIDVAVAVERVGAKSVTFAFTFTRGGDLLATGKASAVFCRVADGHRMESVEIPAGLRGKLTGDAP